MANPTADGRMINRAISDSDKFAALSPEAAVLFTMLIPWFNAHGKLNGGPGFIKDEICPKIPYLTYENIPTYLKEISEKTSVKWFQSGGRYWLHSLKFNSEHQKLEKKLGVDKLPSFTPGLVEEKSQTTPELVEIKSPLKDKGKDKGKAKESLELQSPVDNSQVKNASLKNQKTEDEKTELQKLVIQINEKYPRLAINIFLQNHSRDNPRAIIHTLKSLLAHEIKIPEPMILMKYLETTIQDENKNYNARDSETRNNEFKKDVNPMAGLMQMINAIGKPMPAGG